MGRRFFASISALALAFIFASLAPTVVAGQGSKAKAWSAPRTADGQPDFADLAEGWRTHFLSIKTDFQERYGSLWTLGLKGTF